MPAEFIFDDRHHQRAASRRECDTCAPMAGRPIKRTAWLFYAVFRTERNEDERLMRSRIAHGEPFHRGHTRARRQGGGAIASWTRSFCIPFPPTWRSCSTGSARPDARSLRSREFSPARKCWKIRCAGAPRKYSASRSRRTTARPKRSSAWECPAGNHHVNAEHVLLEIVDEWQSAGRARSRSVECWSPRWKIGSRRWCATRSATTQSPRPGGANAAGLFR